MRGKLTGNGVRLYAHEWLTVEYFLERGEDVELIEPSYRIGGKNADFIMRMLVWEAKYPTSNNCKTLIVTLRRATKQSANIVVDLRRVKGGDLQMRRELKKFFDEVSRVRNLLVITKKGVLIEYKKR